VRLIAILLNPTGSKVITFKRAQKAEKQIRTDRNINLNTVGWLNRIQANGRCIKP